jgi:tRNA (guanine-N7-)-methyltransferase
MDAAAEQRQDRAISPTWRREPVSFARRGGRLTDRQRRAWDALHDTYVLDVPRDGMSTSVDPAFRLDPATAFGRRAPLIVEIGSGRGEALVDAAADRPDHDFLGLEVYVPGVAQTLVTMRHREVTNIRLAVVNAAEALATMIEPASVRELWTWFPDPWHKKRHHKRRLVTVPFTALVARVLEPGGTWRFATDWDDYAAVAADVIAASPHVEGGPVARHDGRALTRFEGKGIAAGRRIHDLAARPTLTR